MKTFYNFCIEKMVDDTGVRTSGKGTKYRIANFVCTDGVDSIKVKVWMPLVESIKALVGTGRAVNLMVTASVKNWNDSEYMELTLDSFTIADTGIAGEPSAPASGPASGPAGGPQPMKAVKPNPFKGLKDVSDLVSKNNNNTGDGR